MKKLSKYWTLVGIVGVLALATPCIGSWVNTSFSQDLPTDEDTGDETTWHVKVDWNGGFSATDSSLYGSVTESSAYAYANAIWEYPAPPLSRGCGADAVGSAYATWSWSGAPGASPTTTVLCGVTTSGWVETTGQAYTCYGGTAYASSGVILASIAGEDGPIADCSAFANGSATSSFVDGSLSVSQTGEGTVTPTNNTGVGLGGYYGKYIVDVNDSGSYQIAAGAGSFSAYSTLGSYAYANGSASGSIQDHPFGASLSETFHDEGNSLVSF